MGEGGSGPASNSVHFGWTIGEGQFRIHWHTLYALQADALSSYVQDVSSTRFQEEVDEVVKLKDNAELMSEFRSRIGSLQWFSGTTRADTSADLTLLPKGREDLTTEDLNEINRTIRYVKATEDATIRSNPVNPKNIWLRERSQQQVSRRTGHCGNDHVSSAEHHTLLSLGVEGFFA